MTKKTNRFYTILLPCAATLFISGCHAEKQEKETKTATHTALPQQGDFYYVLDGSDVYEFIHFNFNNKKVSGAVYWEGEYDEKVYNSFGGTVTSDTSIRVHVAYTNAELLEDWIIHLSGKEMTVRNMMGRTTAVLYTRLVKMPDTTGYIFAGDMPSEPIFPETLPDCYESSYAHLDPNKRIQLHEYIQLWNTNGEIVGRGSGASEGDPDWSFYFEGEMANDSTMEVTVHYSQQGKAMLTKNETWVLNAGKTKMRVKNPFTGRNGADLYDKTECEFFPQPMIDLMPSGADGDD